MQTGEHSRERSGRAVKIIVVDDEPVIADTLVNILNGEGHDALAASNGKSALVWARKFSPDVVVTDVMMPGMNGVETAKAITKELPNCRVILFSGQAASTEIVAAAHNEGYRFEILAKPVNPDVLLATINNGQTSAF